MFHFLSQLEFLHLEGTQILKLKNLRSNEINLYTKVKHTHLLRH